MNRQPEPGGGAPDKNFSQVVQQRCDANFFHVDVVPPDRPVLRVVGGPLGAANDLQYAEQGRCTAK